MYTEITRNKRNTIALMVAFIAFISALGWLISQYLGRPSMLVGVTIFALVYAVFGYFMSAKIALALSGAKPIEKADAPQLYRVIENLSITAGLPMPQVYIIDDPAPNAFATGRDPQHAAVAVTTGLMSMLDDTEIEGVLAHEMSHVGNYDIRLMSLVIVLVTIVSLVSDFFARMLFWGGDNDNDNRHPATAVIGLIMALVAPIVATLLQLAVSRKREYLADASGALLTRYPDGLASALAKIGSYNRPMRHASTATAHLYIANPLNGASRRIGRGIAALFSTHPPIEDRIARLQKMEVQP